MFLVVLGIGSAPTLLSANTPIMVISLSSFSVLGIAQRWGIAPVPTTTKSLGLRLLYSSYKVGVIVPSHTGGYAYIIYLNVPKGGRPAGLSGWPPDLL
jgi:hypothetical protein